MSGRIGWTYELFKIFGWYPGQKHLKTDQNSLKTKWFIYGLFLKWPICSFPMLSHMENRDFLVKYEFSLSCCNKSAQSNQIVVSSHILHREDEYKLHFHIQPLSRALPLVILPHFLSILPLIFHRKTTNQSFIKRPWI